jgi:hypothetical protein
MKNYFSFQNVSQTIDLELNRKNCFIFITLIGDYFSFIHNEFRTSYNN